MFILGFTFSEIKTALESYTVKSLGGSDGWNHQNIKSILTNEKYKGDALLQKSFTVDFMTKKKKKNEGELPMYYVENNHQAIIPKRIHDYVQRKINNDVTIRVSLKGLLLTVYLPTILTMLLRLWKHNLFYPDYPTFL